MSRSPKVAAAADRTQFSSLLLAQSTALNDAGRADARGIINVFWAWGFPCFRSATALVNVLNLGKGEHAIDISCRKARSRHQPPIATLQVTAKAGQQVVSAPALLKMRLEGEGVHEVVASMESQGRQMVQKTPFLVRLKPWPTFSRKQKMLLRKHPDLASQLKVSFECPKCHGFFTEFRG